MKLTKKQKQNIAAELLPFIVQALYNAKKTITREVYGTWWEVPEEQLKATEYDCNMILNVCKKLGIYPICGEEDGYLTHIWDVEVGEILEKFNWEMVEQGKYLTNMINHISDEKIKNLKKKLEKEYKNADLERDKKVSANIQKQFLAKYAVIQTAYESFSKLRQKILVLKYQATKLRSAIPQHPDMKKFWKSMEDVISQTKRFMLEYEKTMSAPNPLLKTETE